MVYFYSVYLNQYFFRTTLCSIYGGRTIGWFIYFFHKTAQARIRGRAFINIWFLVLAQSLHCFWVWTLGLSNTCICFDLNHPIVDLTVNIYPTMNIHPSVFWVMFSICFLLHKAFWVECKIWSHPNRARFMCHQYFFWQRLKRTSDYFLLTMFFFFSQRP